MFSFVIGGCSATPDKSAMEEVIVNHFSNRDYKVVHLAISAVRPVGMEKLQYMGTEGYLVDISILSLELQRDLGEPWKYKKGQQLTFTNALITIRKKPGNTEEWIVAHISGVPLP
ncbi:MAG: hypothetical protein JSU90_07485 [Nitrospiraceae bacterium]|nr:MAG: hypothetical protein JSU90_07485 [Nitrospiraceae bacterium]